MAQATVSLIIRLIAAVGFVGLVIVDIVMGITAKPVPDWLYSGSIALSLAPDIKTARRWIGAAGKMLSATDEDANK